MRHTKLILIAIARGERDEVDSLACLRSGGRAIFVGIAFKNRYLSLGPRAINDPPGRTDPKRPGVWPWAMVVIDTLLNDRLPPIAPLS